MGPFYRELCQSSLIVVFRGGNQHFPVLAIVLVEFLSGQAANNAYPSIHILESKNREVHIELLAHCSGSAEGLVTDLVFFLRPGCKSSYCPFLYRRLGDWLGNF